MVKEKHPQFSISKSKRFDYSRKSLPKGKFYLPIQEDNSPVRQEAGEPSVSSKWSLEKRVVKEFEFASKMHEPSPHTYDIFH